MAAIRICPLLRMSAIVPKQMRHGRDQRLVKKLLRQWIRFAHNNLIMGPLQLRLSGYISIYIYFNNSLSFDGVKLLNSVDSTYCLLQSY